MRLIILTMLPALWLFYSCNKDEIKEHQSGSFIKFFADGGMTIVGNDVKQTADGGYAILGTAVYEEDETSDMYLIGTDKYGNGLSWSPVLIGHNYDDEGNKLEVLNDGFALLGSSDTSGNGTRDIYFVKTDLQGNILWERWFGRPNFQEVYYNEEGFDVLPINEGGFILAGYTDDPLITNGGKDAYFIITNEDASVIEEWRTFGWAGGDEIVTSLQKAGDEYVAVGITGSLSVNDEILVIRLNSSLSEPLAIGILTGGNAYNASVIVNDAGGIFILANSYATGTNVSEIFFGKLEMLAPPKLDWSTMIKETGFNLSGYDITLSSEGFFAITGTRATAADQNLLFMQLDSEGNHLNTTYFGESGFQAGTAIEYTSSDNGYIITGYNEFEAFSMVALVKTGPEGRLE